MQPISVIFTVPEIELPAVLDALRSTNSPAVEAWDRVETSLLATGTLETVDNQIDTATGTIKLRARSHRSSMKDALTKGTKEWC
jgi:multidrug efflux system membrane fusion protein